MRSRMQPAKHRNRVVIGSISRSWESFLPGSGLGLWRNMYFITSVIVLAAVGAVLLLMPRENAVSSNIVSEDSQSWVFSEENISRDREWNYSSFSFEPKVTYWDQLRARLLEQNQTLSLEDGARPRVMMVTGSSPEMCDPSVLSHLLLKSAKNKLDYCRMHEMEFFYNLGDPNPNFSDWWAKLPVIRMLMLQHPELEWIWWLDADAILTDLSFEPPFADLKDYNLVFYGDDQLIDSTRDWKSVSTANFMIRNCQWSLDLLDAWGSIGTDRMREQFESELLANRPSNFPGDDQSSMIALLAQDQRNTAVEQKWVPSVKLVNGTEYVMSRDWKRVGPHLEELSLDEANRVPFVTLFTGCLPACNGQSDQLPSKLLDVCTKQLERAFDFADNQVYRHYGFQPRILGSSSSDALKKSEASPTHDKVEKVEEEMDLRLPPVITDWNERRQVWIQQNPSVKEDEVLLVSGSKPTPCDSKEGGHILIRAFKNRIDYARINGISKVFYNMAVVDKDMTGWWCKLPLLKMLMLSNPNIEWIWWMDSDAAFTDMAFKLPFSRYNASGYNLVMYGSENEVFGKRSFKGINTGNVLLRNCQWSLDLLDRWASYGRTAELREKNEGLIINFLSDREPDTKDDRTDDQSVLVYVLIKEREKWESKVCLETSFTMSGWWMYWVDLFGDEIEWTSSETKPFVTHFTACKPCGVIQSTDCLVGMDKTYNFADNQVLQRYGLRHVHINSTELLRTSSGVPGR